MIKAARGGSSFLTGFVAWPQSRQYGTGPSRHLAERCPRSLR